MVPRASCTSISTRGPSARRMAVDPAMAWSRSSRQPRFLVNVAHTGAADVTISRTQPLNSNGCPFSVVTLRCVSVVGGQRAGVRPWRGPCRRSWRRRRGLGEAAAPSLGLARRGAFLASRHFNDEKEGSENPRRRGRTSRDETARENLFMCKFNSSPFLCQKI